MNFRALISYFFKKILAIASLGMNITLLLGPQVGTRLLVYRLKYLQTKKKEQICQNSQILLYWNIILFTLLTRLRFSTSAKSRKKFLPPPLTKSWIRYCYDSKVRSDSNSWIWVENVNTKQWKFHIFKWYFPYSWRRWRWEQQRQCWWLWQWEWGSVENLNMKLFCPYYW